MVFNHYSIMASQLVSVDDTGHTSTLNSDQCHQHNKPKISCYASSACNFSVCGDSGISADFLILLLAYSTYRFRQKNNTFPRSFAIAPEIKPPIYRL